MAKESENQLVQITPARKPGKLSLDEVRARLGASTGPRYWRSLEDLSREQGFDELMEREFPRHASEWLDPVSRRNFLKLMGASMALAGLSACTKQPPEHIVPYVKQPENVVPGIAVYYASAMPLPTGALPLLVESHEGRPTKVEGNPQHPASLGATHTFAQASILDLYDPDRAQTITGAGEVRSWGDFVKALQGPLNAQRGLKGSGLRILTETVVSPTLGGQIAALLQAMPGAKWTQYDPMNRDGARAGSRMVFGRYLDPQYKIEGARVIVSLDADFLSGAWFPGFLRYSREYVRSRKQPSPEMARLYVAESTSTTTGGKADHQYRMKYSEIEQFAAALAAAVGVGAPAAQLKPELQKAAQAIAQDLQAHRGSSVIIPGEYQSPAVHALAALMNQALGNVGTTVNYTEPIELGAMEQTAALRELVGEMNAGKVDVLVILGGNPVFNAPADLKFADALNKVGFRAHLSLYRNETSQLCHWHLNEAHYLESWSDARAHDGTVCLIQPLIAPLYDGRSAHEVLNALSDNPGQSGMEILQRYWRTRFPGGNFDQFWRKSLHDGFVAGTTFQPAQVAGGGGGQVQLAQPTQGIEITFRPDPSIYDGRFVNNAWLQELPKPVSKLTWDNAALISFRTAEKLGVATNSVIEIEHAGAKVKAPVHTLVGQPDDTITLYVGYGRTLTGRVGTGTGFNPYKLRTSQAPYAVSGAKVTSTGDEYRLAITQEHNAIALNQAIDRHIVRSATLAEFMKDNKAPHEDAFEPRPDLSMYPDWDYSKGYQWGMAIDLNSCIGCNACVVACQSENNIPVVGKEQVMVGREMHWLRVDTYFDARDFDNPRAYFQPLPCMHCELAPCEPVCPVAATVHSAEGLNDMVYNRCVGTRYCSNNCPYKVRKFNFALWADWYTESFKPMRNPDVTVRSRGVMEKCTYCVQRINHVRIQSEKEDRPIRDMEVVTACQQTCPTEAIVFGNLNDPNSKVSQLKKDARNYWLLPELNTKPRTTYLAEVTNPNPSLEGHKQAESQTHGG